MATTRPVGPVDSVDDLTEGERRYVLAALSFWRDDQVRNLEDTAEDDDDRRHIADMRATCDAAAAKLGGDPTDPHYGAATH